MIKKLSFILVLATQILYSAAQIKTVEVKVNESEAKEVELDRCPCSFSLTALQYGNSGITLSIEIINMQPSHYIFLFGHAYTEKDLKKHNIYFDKSYGSTSKNLELCENLTGNDIMVIEPSRSRTLTYDNISEPMKSCKINLYAAKYKEKGFLSTEKYNIVEFFPVTLNVNFKVDEVAEDEYEGIKQMCEDLIDDIENVTICPRKSHPVSKEKQKKQYKDRINELKDSISNIKYVHNWREKDADYQKYKELLRKLDNVEFREKYCGMCVPDGPKTKHHCNYCSNTPDEIYSQLDAIYRSLDNKGQKNKESAVKKADAMHKAWSGGCPNLKQQMKKSSKRKRIEDYYNAIRKF